MTKYIKRHDAFVRAYHWTFAVGGIILALTGLLLFIPGLGDKLGYGTLKTATILHRIFGVLFVGVPILGWIIRPQNFVHTFKNVFAKWDDDDKEFMKLFFVYLFNPKKYHMPKQHFIKSGQRFSDFMMWLCVFGIMLSGILLWVGSNAVPHWLYGLWQLGHDLCFMGIAMMFPIHVYLGGGIFQPYHRVSRVMFGDGLVNESDALYHWGHWAEEELASGKNVVEK